MQVPVQQKHDVQGTISERQWIHKKQSSKHCSISFKAKTNRKDSQMKYLNILIMGTDINLIYQLYELETYLAT